MIEAFVTLGTETVFYREAGDPEGLPVVLVHGNLGSSRWFERVMEAPGYRFLALDLPNFGRSSALEEPVTLERYAEVVSAFRTALELEKPLLVGHSLGGCIAMALVAREPTLYRGLVLIDSAGTTGLQTPVERHPLIEMMRANRALLTQGLGAVVPTLNDPFFLERLIDDAQLMAPHAWIGNAEALTTFNVTGKLHVFTAPVLVLWGRKDALVNETMVDQLRDAFPNVRVEVLETVGHSVIVEDPALFQRLLGQFVATHSLRSPL